MNILQPHMAFYTLTFYYLLPFTFLLLYSFIFLGNLNSMFYPVENTLINTLTSSDSCVAKSQAQINPAIHFLRIYAQVQIEKNNTRGDTLSFHDQLQ